MITKAERNALKRSIIKELTGKNGIFNKQTGYANFNGVNLEMVMNCVFKGLNKHTKDKDCENENT